MEEALRSIVRKNDYEFEIHPIVKKNSLMIDDYINSYYVTVPGNLKGVQNYNSSNFNHAKRYMYNEFMNSSLYAIGGGAQALGKELMSYKRLGGSTQDKLNYLSGVGDSLRSLETTFNCNNDIILEKLGIIDLKKKIGIMPMKEFMKYFSYKPGTSPGYLEKALGFKEKHQTVQVNLLLYKIIRTSWLMSASSPLKPQLIWSSASRPKLLKIRGNNNDVGDILSGKPCSRLIAVSPILESMLAFPLYYNISEALKLFFKNNGYGIAIGCNRMGSDWALIASHFKESTFILSCDYSKYDQKVSSKLMKKALSVIYEVMSDDVYCVNYLKNYEEWFEKEVINKVYCVDKEFFVPIRGGMPSGTIWTSLMNSIINYIIIIEVMRDMYTEDYKAVVYGDDNLIIVNDKSLDADMFKHEFILRVKLRFDMDIKEEDTVVTLPDEYYVKYERPVFKPGDYLMKGTRDLQAMRIEESETPFLTWDHNKGTTHRWNYVFSRRVKFLQYYWTKDHLPIRPLRESLVRILHPEEIINNVYEHEALVIAHLIDNYHNAHLRNWTYHLLYDIEFYKRHKLIKNEQVNHLDDELYNGVDSINNIPKRMWYRHLDIYTNLSKSVSMQGFNYKWEIILEKAEEIHRSIDIFEPYEVKGLVYNMISKSQMTLERASKWYSQGLISISQITHLKYLKMKEEEEREMRGDYKQPILLTALPLTLLFLYMTIKRTPEHNYELTKIETLISEYEHNFNEVVSASDLLIKDSVCKDWVSQSWLNKMKTKEKTDVDTSLLPDKLD